MSTAGRPQLRGLLRRKIAFEAATAVGLGIAVGSIWYLSVAKPRRKKYEDFYKSYDAAADAKNMKASWEQ